MKTLSHMDSEKLCISRCFFRRNGCLIIVIFPLEKIFIPTSRGTTQLLKSLEKPTATFSVSTVSTLVSSPIRKRTQEDQVTLVSWACINSWEVLSSVTKSFPGNHIYTLNSLPSSDSLVGIKINLHWIAEAYKLISLTDSQNVRIWFLARARFLRGLSPFFWNLNCNSVQFKYFKTLQICMLDISGYR